MGSRGAKVYAQFKKSQAKSCRILQIIFLASTLPFSYNSPRKPSTPLSMPPPPASIPTPFSASRIPSPPSASSGPRVPSPRVLRSQTKWENLFFYQKTDVLYQLTVAFCRRFLPKFGDRTVDQMVQAARSGKQNIVEGCADGVTLTETDLRLLNVSRGSLRGLREDSADHLKVCALPVWEAGHSRFDAMHSFCRAHTRTAASNSKRSANSSTDNRCPTLATMSWVQSLYHFPRQPTERWFAGFFFVYQQHMNFFLTKDNCFTRFNSVFGAPRAFAAAEVS